MVAETAGKVLYDDISWLINRKRAQGCFRQDNSLVDAELGQLWNRDRALVG